MLHRSAFRHTAGGGVSGGTVPPRPVFPRRQPSDTVMNGTTAMNSSWGPLFTPLVAVVGGLIRIRRAGTPRPPGRAAEIMLLWFSGAVVGAGGLIVTGSHLVFADFAAGQIGFPAGNPFQFEVAVDNLSSAVLGLACLRFRGRFWDATAIGFAVFYLGATYGHLQRYFAHYNTAPYNAGARRRTPPQQGCLAVRGHSRRRDRR